MAHGFGCDRAFVLPKAAEFFASHGFCVLLFDYRTFGDSGGEPRYNVDPITQGEDWLAAIQYAQKLDNVDAANTVLWGTSYSGGHVLVAAAKANNIKAVLALVPYVGGEGAEIDVPLSYQIKGGAAAIWDVISSKLFNKPYYVKMAASPPEFSIGNSEEVVQEFAHMVPKGYPWANRVQAKCLLKIGPYNPVDYAVDIHCPVLLIGAVDDNVTTIESIRNAHKTLKSSTLIELEGRHFQVYQDKVFAGVLERQLNFLGETFVLAQTSQVLGKGKN